MSESNAAYFRMGDRDELIETDGWDFPDGWWDEAADWRTAEVRDE